MAFKLSSDANADFPMLICDVCGEKVFDIWNDKATGSPVDGQVTEVKVHHAKCQATGTVTISLIDFLRLFVVQNRVGDLGSSGSIDKVSVEYPTGKGFEA